MRWTDNDYGREEGDTRTLTRFLWWPRTINGETRWLERASWVQRLERGPAVAGYGGGVVIYRPNALQWKDRWWVLPASPLKR